MRFVFAIVIIVWLATALFSKKRRAIIKEKDGWPGILLASTALLFVLSMLVLVGTVIYAGETYEYRPLDCASVFFFSVMALLVLELIICMAFPKRKKDAGKL